MPTSPPVPGAGTWHAGLLELLGALGGLALALTVGYSWQGRRMTDLTRRIRWGLAVWIGGLVGYLLFGFGVIRPNGWPGWPVGLILAWAGGLVGGGIVRVIVTRDKQPAP